MKKWFYAMLALVMLIICWFFLSFPSSSEKSEMVAKSEDFAEVNLGKPKDETPKVKAPKSKASVPVKIEIDNGVMRVDISDWHFGQSDPELQGLCQNLVRQGMILQKHFGECQKGGPPPEKKRICTLLKKNFGAEKVHKNATKYVVKVSRDWRSICKFSK